MDHRDAVTHRCILHRTKSVSEATSVASYMNMSFPANGFSHGEDGFCKFVFCDGDSLHEDNTIEVYYFMKIIKAYLDGLSDGKYGS